MTDIPEWAMREAKTILALYMEESGGEFLDAPIARALVKAKEQGIAEGTQEERARWGPAIIYFNNYVEDEEDSRECCISDEHHEDAKEFGIVVRAAS